MHNHTQVFCRGGVVPGYTTDRFHIRDEKVA